MAIDHNRLFKELIRTFFAEFMELFFPERMFLYFSRLFGKYRRSYIKQNNPVAAALLSKMGYNKKERVQVKMECLRMLLRMKLDPARMHMITVY